MCPPTHFEVTYAINPWMDTTVPVDVERAQLQWEVLRNTYLSLGHRSTSSTRCRASPTWSSPPTAGSSSAGARTARSSGSPSAAAEGGAYATWLTDHGYRGGRARQTNEGEGDFLALGRMILAGTGFRTSLERAHRGRQGPRPPGRLARARRPAVLPPRHRDRGARRRQRRGPGRHRLLPGRLQPAQPAHPARPVPRRDHRAREEDALVLGLNAVSDGHHVVCPAAATGLRCELSERGYTPVPVDLGEFLKSGGSVKCCTMELHA